MRDALEALILEWMGKDENVLFLTADIGGGLFKNLRRIFPQRTINAGIAEQNMIGMAAGLTNVGFRVICYSKACFISLRVIDQIKNALCYAGNNVVLIGADAGYDEADAGYSHISMEDIGALRSLAEIEIYVPTTPSSLKACFWEAVQCVHPSYIRLNKEGLSVSTEGADKGIYYLKEVQKCGRLIVTQGISAKSALEWSKKHLQPDNVIAVDRYQGISDLLLEEIRQYEEIIVFEEQFKRNGLYSLIAELMTEENVRNTRLLRIGPKTEYKRECFNRCSKVNEEMTEFESVYGI